MASLSDILALIEERIHPRAAVAAHHPAGLIAINKGAGLLSHPNTDSDSDAADKKSGYSELALRRGLGPSKKNSASETKEAPAWLDAPYNLKDEVFNLEGNQVFLCNRLDSATSGIFILCTDSGLAAHLKELWSKQDVTKIYLAILRGGPSRPYEKWSDTLKRSGKSKEKGVRMQAKQGPVRAGGQLAKTIVRRVHQITTMPRMALVSMEPLTGRTHQLRVQSDLHRCPILGDAKYGDFRFNKAMAQRIAEIKGRLFLHSYLTHIAFEYEGKNITFKAEAPLPQSFLTVLKGDFTQSIDRTVKAILVGK